MDCEGCECDAILSIADDILRRFSYIQIEYHYGYKNLKEKLEKSGFTVSITRPILMPHPESDKRLIGSFYARLLSMGEEVSNA